MMTLEHHPRQASAEGALKLQLKQECHGLQSSRASASMHADWEAEQQTQQASAQQATASVWASSLHSGMKQLP